MNLSKTKFCTGLQCHKLLYWTIHERGAPELVPDRALQYRFDTGHEVGERACTLFSGGVFIDASPSEKDKAVAETAVAIKAGVPSIYEASFRAHGIYVRVDILERCGKGGWRIVEVKSSTKVKPEYIPDMAVQWFVLESSGVQLEGADLMHLNPECRHPDLSNLFARNDCTADVKEFLPFVAPEAEKMIAMLERPEAPEVDIGPHCSESYECPFAARCWPEPIPHHIGELYRKQRRQLEHLEAEGIVTIDQIPEHFPLQDIQQRQRRAIREGRPVVTGVLTGRLSEVEYPIHYLDFETFAPAIPRYPGTGPYNQTAVQFSVHVLHEKGLLEHHDCLSEAGDPRPEVAGRLLEALGSRGTIVTYSPFEKTQIRSLAESVPGKRSELEGLIPRLWDLCQVLREGVFHPDFRGSFGIKSTYPALCPKGGYDDLEVAEGFGAMALYDELMREATPEEAKERIRADLHAYCGRDTRAMVEVHEVLKSYAESGCRDG